MFVLFIWVVFLTIYILHCEQIQKIGVVYDTWGWIVLQYKKSWDIFFWHCFAYFFLFWTVIVLNFYCTLRCWGIFYCKSKKKLLRKIGKTIAIFCLVTQCSKTGIFGPKSQVGQKFQNFENLCENRNKT